MKANKIALECDQLYAQIARAQGRLKELRAMCKHENKFLGNYSWRVGCIDKAIMCFDCGELIRLLNSDLDVQESDTTEAK